MPGAAQLTQERSSGEKDTVVLNPHSFLPAMMRSPTSAAWCGNGCQANGPKDQVHVGHRRFGRMLGGFRCTSPHTYSHPIQTNYIANRTNKQKKQRSRRVQAQTKKRQPSICGLQRTARATNAVTRVTQTQVCLVWADLKQRPQTHQHTASGWRAFT